MDKKVGRVKGDNMNIYEEALKSANHLGNVNAHYNGGYSSEHEDNIVKALTRAKKVEEMNIEQEEYIQALLFDRLYTQEKCVKKIAKIKKELEEMK